MWVPTAKLLTLPAAIGYLFPKYPNSPPSHSISLSLVAVILKSTSVFDYIYPFVKDPGAIYPIPSANSALLYALPLFWS